MRLDLRQKTYDALPPLARANLMVWVFGLTQVRMIALARPRVTEISDERCVVRIPLAFWTRNHLRSMYLGVLTMGADLAGGLMAMDAAFKIRRPVVPVFKDLQAEFLRRADGPVDFVCNDGAALHATVARCIATGSRQSTPVQVLAQVAGVDVARFGLTVSVKPER